MLEKNLHAVFGVWGEAPFGSDQVFGPNSDLRFLLICVI